MRVKKLPPIEELRYWFTYSPDSGKLYWKNSPGCKVRVGTLAGSPDTKGHLQTKLRGRMYYNHRLVWMLVTGNDPAEMQVDHINRNKRDNRFSNLRLASHSQNVCNIEARRGTASGIKGVTWSAPHSRWRARVAHNKRVFNAGLHDSKHAAAEAVRELRQSLHKEFTNHG